MNLKEKPDSDSSSSNNFPRDFFEKLQLQSITSITDISNNDELLHPEISDTFQSPPSYLSSPTKIGIYTPEERMNKISKYRKKIQKFHEKVPLSRAFKGRSNIAQKKPRIKGRFVSQEEYEKALQIEEEPVEKSLPPFSLNSLQSKKRSRNSIVSNPSIFKDTADSFEHIKESSDTPSYDFFSMKFLQDTSHINSIYEVSEQDPADIYRFDVGDYFIGEEFSEDDKSPV